MTKIISVSDDVYEKLKALKGRDSFSMVIRFLIKNSSNKEKILSFVGKGDFDDKRLEELRKGWKKWSEKYV